MAVQHVQQGEKNTAVLAALLLTRNKRPVLGAPWVLMALGRSMWRTQLSGLNSASSSSHHFAASVFAVKRSPLGTWPQDGSLA